MKKMKVPAWYVLFANMALVTLVGCNNITPTILPSPSSPTVVSPFNHYIPSKEFNIHLEFDYPSSWIFSEEKREANIITLGLADPRFRTLPTLSSENFHRTPNDFGSVVIWVFPIETDHTLSAEVEAFKQNSYGNNRVTFLNEYKIKIDGYEAGVLEYQINDAESYTSLMFERSTFFIVENQLYKIFFKIAVKDRGSEFEKDYEYFFNSLEIIP